MSDVTAILSAIERGDVRATDKLLPLVYEELHILTAQKLSYEVSDQTLHATAFVREAYSRLVEDESRSWENRGHFFAAAEMAADLIHAKQKSNGRTETADIQLSISLLHRVPYGQWHCGENCLRYRNMILERERHEH